MTFTTLPVTAPGVTTSTATGISYNRATLNASLNSLGTAEIVTVTFEYARDDYYTANGHTYNFATGASQEMNATGSLSLNISGLATNTLYHFRAKANGGIHGVSFGSDMTLATLSVTTMEISSLPASGIGQDRATLNGSLDSLGTAGTVYVYFEYATDEITRSRARPMTAKPSYRQCRPWVLSLSMSAD